MRTRTTLTLLGTTAALVAATAAGGVLATGLDRQDGGERFRGRRAKNVILFIGDGMGVSTITATRVFTVGVAGQLVVDQFPYTALSRTYSADSITPDSAPTMTAMMTGVNTNAGRASASTTPPRSAISTTTVTASRLWTLLEQAKQSRHAGRRRQHRAHHARDTRRDLRPHQQPRRRERDRAAGAARRRDLQPRLGEGVDVLLAAAVSSSCRPRGR